MLGSEMMHPPSQKHTVNPLVENFNPFPSLPSLCTIHVDVFSFVLQPFTVLHLLSQVLL